MYPKYAPHQTDETPLIAPGPPNMLGIGSTLLLRNNRLYSFLAIRNQYGDVVRFQVGRRIVHLVSHPDLVKYVLQDNNRNYTKGRGLEKARSFLGEGLLTSEGDFWRRQRRLMQPAFHRQEINAFLPLMVESTNIMLERWRTLQASGTTTLEVAGEMMCLTLEVVSRTLFSTGLSQQEMDIVAEAMPIVLREANLRINSLLDVREKLPIPAKRRFQREIAALDAIVYRIIEDRRRSAEAKPDLLGMLMAAQDEDSGERMTDRQVRDEVMTIFLAGHETTANNLAWTLYLLSRHPGERSRVQQEVDQTLGGAPPTLEDIPRLVYTRQVLDESLRLYPPAWAITRKAIDADQIGGYSIPGGTNVIISPYVIHRHPDFWVNPEGFDPQRFTAQASQGRPHYAYLPFGGGTRQCIGNNFALLEGTLILAMITQRFALDLVPGYVVEPETTITLRPRYGIHMTLRSRF
jgi:cytochrome P450